MARKALIIDWKRVEKMLRYMCDGTDIAASLGIYPDTLYRACKREHKQLFSDYAASFYAATRLLLREQQINRAVGYKRIESKPFNTAQGVVFHDVTVYYEPSDTMLKWLGIQYLGQKDKQDVTVEIPDFVIVNDTDEEEADDSDE
jgi:hypothetical protein